MALPESQGWSLSRPLEPRRGGGGWREGAEGREAEKKNLKTRSSVLAERHDGGSHSFRWDRHCEGSLAAGGAGGGAQ